MAKKSAPRTGAPRSTMQPADRVRLEHEFDRPHLMGPLFGQYDENLIVIERELGVHISARGNKVAIEGDAESVARARDVLTGWSPAAHSMPATLPVQWPSAPTRRSTG